MPPSRTHRAHRGTYASHVAYRASVRATPGGNGFEGAFGLHQLNVVLGIGVFVGFGVAADVAGPGALPAIALAAVVAACNALSTAPVASASNRTPPVGGVAAFSSPLRFAGGWMFLCAKASAAATAALGLTGYLLMACDTFVEIWRIPVALSALGILSVPLLSGLHRPSAVNTVIAVATLTGVVLLALVGGYASVTARANLAAPFALTGWAAAGASPIAHATAIMLVAYAGVGGHGLERDSVRKPGGGVLGLVAVATLVYLVVATVGLGTIGSTALARATGETAAPLFDVGRAGVLPGAPTVVAIGAVVAMAGMLWHLLYDVARMLEVLGPRGDLTTVFVSPSGRRSLSAPAVALSVLAVAGLALVRDVRVTWSLSAFTLLVSYAIANLATLHLPAGTRSLPRSIPLVVFGICLLLAFTVEPAIWRTGLGLLALGMAWHWLARRGEVRTAGPRVR